MKLIHLSDTHFEHTKVRWPCPLEDVDVIIHSGDFTDVGEEYQVSNFFDWFKSLPVKYKIVIAGNHDKSFDRKFWGGVKSDDRYGHRIMNCKEWLPNHIKEFKKNEGCYYLFDEAITIDGINFYGSPWSVSFHPEYWAFNLNDDKDSYNMYNKIPLNTHVLITHGPPYGKLDYTFSNTSVGSHYLIQRVETVKPKFHLFGHIHECYGQASNEHTTFINSSFQNPLTGRHNTPQVFEI